MPKISAPHYNVFSNVYFPIDNVFPAFTVLQGTEMSLTNMGIVARRAKNTSVHLNAIGWLELVNQSFAVSATADRTRVETLYQYIEDYSYPSSSYRNIKTNQLWKDIYAIKPGPIFHWNKKTGATQYPQIDFGFCLGNCGYQLPLSVLTIDHQRAQSLTGLEVLMRMFRGMGLTLGAPAGIKNKNMLTRWATAVGGNTDLTRSKAKDDQNSLSMQGVLYYSIFKKLGVVNELNDIAMHHFLNLRPMCGPCNSARGNQATIVY